MLSLKSEGPVSSLPANMRDRYVLRCIDPQFKISSKGNPMFMLKWEMVGYHDPKTGAISDTISRWDDEGKPADFLIAGAQVTTYHNITAKNFENLRGFLKTLGLYEEIAPGESIDDKNPPTDPFKGVCAFATCYSKESIQRKDQTPEQKEKGEAGDPILGPDGKEIKSLQLEVYTWIGRCPPDVEETIQNNNPMGPY